MRIAINCRSFLKRQYTGIGRYTYHLVKSLSEIDRTNEYQLYARRELFNFHKKTPRFPAKNFNSRVDWFGRGLAGTLKDIDICHFPSPGSLESPDRSKIIVTVHDIIFKAFPQGHTSSTIEAGEAQFREIQERASKIICCSQSTVDDLKKYFQVPDEKIALVYQGVDKSIFYPIESEENVLAERILAKHGVDEPYILSVGTIEPRKNLTNLIQAFHTLRVDKKFSGKLVIIGMQGWLNDDLAALVEKLKLTSHIVFLGYVSDQELRAFYNKAEVFAFPSFYEGFGFPIVEAFCCGTPVVTSNSSSCPEIAGDAALLIQPDMVASIAEAIERVTNDHDLKKALSEKGLKRADNFDFSKTARETLRVYEEVYRQS